MRKMMRAKRTKMIILGGVLAVVFAFCAGPVSADMAAAKKWVENEFQPSTLTKAQQMKEMEAQGELGKRGEHSQNGR